MNLTLAILVASAVAYLTKLSGYFVPTERLDRDRVNDLAGTLTVGLLAALVVTNTFAASGHVVLDARVVALVAAAIALSLRAPFILVVVIGAAAAAVTRALGWG